MTLSEFKSHCLSYKGVEENYPVRGEAVWMMVMGKMFAMTNVRELKMEGEMVPPFYFINLKCEPDRAVRLRKEYSAIQAAWHQNKRHWNTLYMDDSLSDKLIKTLTKHSYDLVIASLPEKSRKILL